MEALVLIPSSRAVHLALQEQCVVLVQMPSTFRDWPVPLGAWRSPDPKKEGIRIHGGRRSCLLGFGPDPDQDPSDPSILLSASIVPAAPSD